MLDFSVLFVTFQDFYRNQHSKLLYRNQPKMIIAGFSAFSGIINWKTFLLLCAMKKKVQYCTVRYEKQLVSLQYPSVIYCPLGKYFGFAILIFSIYRLD